MDKSVLEQLSDLKLQFQTISVQLQDIKNQIPEEMNDACAKACLLAPELELLISLQQDLLVYSKREDSKAVEYVKDQLSKVLI